MAFDWHRRRLITQLIPVLTGAGALEFASRSGIRSAHAAEKLDKGVALFVGNTTYKPSSQDILTAKKNVRDMEDVLGDIGFRTESIFNAGREEISRALDKLIDSSAAMPGKPVLFYFCGHGINSLARGQYRNFLVSSGVELVPSAAVLASPDGRRRHYETVASQSVALEDDIFPRIAKRDANSLGIVIIDACRDASNDVTDSDNRIVQSRPPDGCIAAFATRPGRYAYTPRDYQKNSFFTEALLDQLRAVNDEGDLTQLLQRVRLQVRERVNKIARDEGSLDRLLARLGLKEGYLQEPETASSVSGRALLRPALAVAQPPAPSRPTIATAPATTPPPPVAGARPPATTPAAPARPTGAQAIAELQRVAAARWTEIEAMEDPDQIEPALDDFIARFADSPLHPNAILRKEDMAKVRVAQRKARLSRSRLALPASGPLVQDYRAARQGDKFAAHRIAEAIEKNPAIADPAAAVRWLQYAAELGNGIAAYDAYRRFNQRNLLQEASYYLNLAEANGYRVPRDFDTRK